MNKNRLKIIGDIMLDEWIFGKNTKKSSEANIDIFENINSKKSLGGVGNLCQNLKSLGVNFELFSEIGDDSNGKILKKILNEKNIKHNLLNKKRYTTSKKRYFTDNQQIFREDIENVSINKSVGQIFLKKIRKNDIVIISDYRKGCIDKYLHSKIIKKKCITFVDPKNNPEFYKDAFLIKPNMEKFKEWCGVFSKKKAFQLIKKMRWSWLIISHNKEGVYVFNKFGYFNKYKVKKVKKPNVVGAGDIFFSGIIHNYLLNYDIFTSVELSSFAATKCVEKKQIRIVKKNDFKKEIVFTNGVFDVLHKGHIDLLKFCKKIGKKVYLGINSDSSVKRLKGKKRPYNYLKIRIKHLKKTNLIDKIIVFKDLTPMRIINQIKPDVIVKGEDYNFRNIVGSNNFNSIIFKKKRDISSTKLINILNNRV